MPPPGLLARAADADALLRAWQRVAAKRAAGGLDGVTVAEFERDLHRNLDRLRQDLLDGRYLPHPLQRVAIPKDSSPGDTRTLHLPAVRDKIAQETVRAVLEPVLDRRFLDCSYGYRPGRGPRRAIARVTHYALYMKRHWIVTADIDDFFGSLDQTRLVDRLRDVVADEGIIRLIQLWLRMGAVDARGRWHDVRSGVGQGAVISPLLANFYLHEFDQALVEQRFGLVRYADDFVVLCGTRSEAEDALARATELLRTRLRLRLNDNPRPIAALEDGFAFLGIRFQGAARTIDPAKLDQIGAKISRIARHGDTSRALGELNAAITGWRHHYAALVSPDHLVPLAELVASGLAQIVAEGLRSKRWRSQAEAAEALAGVETLTPMATAQRRDLIDSVVRRAWADARPAGLASTGRPPRPKPRPATPPARAARGDTVEGAVRRARRRHTRELAQISELVLNTPGTFLGKTGGRVVVRRERRNVAEVPVGRLTGVTLASQGIALSSDVVTHCADHDIPLLFVSSHARVVAVLSAPESPRGRVGVLQLRALADGKPAFDLARRFAVGKIRNQMTLMKYVHKYRKRADPAFAEAFPRHLAAIRDRLRELGHLPYDTYESARDRVFSCEGRAAQEYWALVRLLVRGRAEFPGRQRRGATDLVNSLLNYGYALLQARVYLAVLRAGLNPQVSFLHAPARAGEPTLAFDLMEEFRPEVVDRTVLALLGRREPVAVDPEGRLTEDTRRRLITQVHDRLATLVRFRGREMKVDEIIHAQARLLVHHLEGTARYRSFAARW